MTTRIPLNLIFDNPFQTRHYYADIADLAASILKMKSARPQTSGLLQVPPARLVIPNRRSGLTLLNPDEYGGVQSTLDDEPDAIIQLAAGHRRLRAFHHLLDQDQDYQTFPVDLLPLDDPTMADIAWEENAKRKDLTPIDEAQALAAAIDIFGYKQVEIGQRWGLSQSAVANKLRLLKLPQDAQEALRLGLLTEKAARALLTAQSKSDRIYHHAARDIIATPVDPDTAQTAQDLHEEHCFSRAWNGYNRPDLTRCTACHNPINPDDPLYLSNLSDDITLYLCQPCYRAAAGWTPPTGPEAEQIVQYTIRRQRTRLTGREEFPLDVEVGWVESEGELTIAPEIIQIKCTHCPARETTGEDDWCLDKDCYITKRELWHQNQVEQLRQRLERDYGLQPDQINIITDYTGHDLTSREIDPDLLKGPCAPGHCPRLQYRYCSYTLDSHLKPYQDLPFIYSCNNTNAHRAAQRRYLDSLQPEDEKSEQVIQTKLIKKRKGQAQRIFSQTQKALGLALAGHHPGAWRYLAEQIITDPTPAHTVEAYIDQIVEKHLFSIEREYITGSHLDNYWTGDDPLADFQQKLNKKLDKYGVPRLPQVVDLELRITKIYDFIQQGRLAGTLTPDQVTGNHTNAQKLIDQIAQLYHQQLLDDHEYKHLHDLLTLDLADELYEAARELDLDIPQDWGISGEISSEGGEAC